MCVSAFPCVFTVTMSLTKMNRHHFTICMLTHIRSVCHMVCSLYKHIMRLPLLIALVLSVIAVLLCAVSLACRPDWIAWNKVEGILAVLPARYGSSL